MASSFYRQWLMLSKIPVQSPGGSGGIGSKDIQEYLKIQGFDLSQRQIQRDLVSFSKMFKDLQSDGNKDKAGWSWHEKSDLISLPNISPTVALSFKLVEFFLNEILPSSVKKSLNPYFKQSNKLLKSQEKKNNLSSWANKVRIVPRTQALIPAEVKPQILHIVYQALLEEKQLKAQYIRRGGEHHTYDIIHPLGLVFRHSVIYLVATIKDYGDLKQFALHRFQKCSLIEQKSVQLDEFNLDDYIASGAFDYTDSDNEFKLIAIFSKQAALHLNETPLSQDQSMVSKRDGRVQITATVKDTSQLRWWLSGFGSNVEIVKPKSLRNEFIEIARQLNTIYKIDG